MVVAGGGGGGAAAASVVAVAVAVAGGGGGGSGGGGGGRRGQPQKGCFISPDFQDPKAPRRQKKNPESPARSGPLNLSTRIPRATGLQLAKQARDRDVF